MQGGAKQWFEQYPLEFRVNTHIQGGKDPWHSVTLVHSGWQAVAATSTAVASSEQGRSIDVETFHSAASDPIAEANYVARLVDHLRGKPHVLLPQLGSDVVRKPDGVPFTLSKVLRRYPDIFSLHLVGASDAVSLVHGAVDTDTHNVTTPCSSEQERPVDIQTFKKQVVELLARSGEIPLGQLTNKHQKAYGHKTQFKPPSTGLRALLLSEAFSSDVDVVPWADSPNPGEFVARLITPSSSDDLELNLLVTTAVSLLKTQPKQTMLLTQLCESLHGEFGKDRCQAVFHAGGGPRACFRSHPQVFRMTLAADGTTMSVTF